MALKNSLYRYYRPVDFNDFVGQKNVVTILKNQIKNNSFSHALLLTGPRGCGKTSLARIFAKAINCEAKPTSFQSIIPCNQCFHCLSVNANKSLNIIELDGASNNGVEEIRNLIENSRLTPIGSPYKVFIIDEVHMLSKGAFNALLKTLEEPPKHVVFILATTELDKIPATIISRCQIFSLQKIKSLEMISRLLFIAQSEKITLEEQAAQEIFNLSEGSLRDALNILQQLIATKNSPINLALVQEYFQIPTQEDKKKILKKILACESQELINYFETIHERGLNLELFILGLLEIIKEILSFKLTGNDIFLKKIDPQETELLEAEINSYFIIGDALSEAFQKNHHLGGDYNYVLIHLLKAIQQLPKINPIKQLPQKNLSKLKLNDFLNQRENLLSKPRELANTLYTTQQIFNILNAPSKSNRDQVSEIFKTIFATDSDQNLINYDSAQAFISWYNGEIVAVSDCETLIRFETEDEVKLFQETIKKPEWEELVKTTFQNSYVVYAIDRKYWEILKREFVLAKTNQNLSDHQHIIWKQIYNSIETPRKEQKDFITLANRLFGDSLKTDGNLPK